METPLARKRFTLALAATFVTTTLFDILLNGLLLREAFAESARYWRPPDELQRLIPLGWASMFGTTACFGMLFVRGNWSGVRRGLEFGMWLGLATSAGVLGMVSLVAWPFQLIAGMAVQQFANSILLGLMFGLLYRSTSNGERTDPPGAGTPAA